MQELKYNNPKKFGDFKKAKNVQNRAISLTKTDNNLKA